MWIPDPSWAMLTLRSEPVVGRDNNPLPDVEKMRIVHGASIGFVDLSPFPLDAIELFGDLAQVIPRLYRVFLRGRCRHGESLWSDVVG